ncbi:ABC transporter ATP-binding protein [Chelatococcus reniformis]|uniref:ABC transporter n=1 Tax=Chelatococcus reniformis TaxID=1494448 RepID=A0A916UPF2_9HYPH|nr:ABC transporter ATP-binding protein [Chelatococcus reniformis]GGC81983.1 ABC transporter [Chelatococcus reniformis]
MRIDARDIHVRFGDAQVLRGVALAVGPGEMVGLIGANGAGKSTLLRVLAGVQAPGEGAVLYDGRPSRAIGERELARRVAFLAQDGEALWPLSVAAVVALGRLPYRRPFAGLSAADRAAVGRAMGAAEVKPFRERVVGTLSGGERMRVLLARALAVEGDILLADEPIAALDPLHQLQVMALLRATARRGAGVVVVLHDLTLAARFCGRLVLLSGGRVLADGPAEAVLADANVAEAYGVTLARGERAGETYLLPWEPVAVGCHGHAHIREER